MPTTSVMPFDDFTDDFDKSDPSNMKTADFQSPRRTLKDSLKPVLWLLRLTGLLHGVSLKGPCQKHHVTEMISRSCCSPALLYCIIVLCLLWCNVALSLLPFQNATSFDGAVCNQIITSTWYFQVACTAFSNIIFCKKWNNIFVMWDKSVNSLDPMLQVGIRRSAIVVTVLYVMWLLAEFGFVGLGAYLMGGGGIGTVNSFTSNLSFNAFIQFALILIFYYFVSTWYLMTATFSILAFGLYRAFKRFQKQLQDYFVDGKFKGDIEELRQKHHGLVNLLAAIDDVMSTYIMLVVGTIIPLIIFTLYFVLFESIDRFSYAATWWSVSLSVVQMMVVFIGGGLVNHMAHYPMEFLYGIDLKHRSSEECHQVSVFLNQLTSHPIGFTAFGLFTIDKPTIITFAGSIVTYAVVVIQFKPSDSSVDTSQVFCNCSCV